MTTAKEPRLTPGELDDFLHRHYLDKVTFAKMLDVTPGAVTHWLTGTRKIPSTVAKLVRVFERDPSIMDEL